MKSVSITAPGQIEIQDVADPTPGANDVVVEVNPTRFTQDDYNLIQQLNDIIFSSGEIGQFELGNLKITINSLQEYQNDLIHIYKHGS
jgi:NADPH:quinone reductase-like Zn-dependent oxidoreductase